MREIGYDYCGPTPHNKNKFKDQWFLKTNDEKEFAKTGVQGFNIHFMSQEGSEEIEDFMRFKEYVEAHPDDFKAYADIKTEAA